MPSISDKLKSLGVNVGTDNLKPSSREEKYPIEAVIEGYEITTFHGQTFVVENTFFSDPRNKDKPLDFTASLSNIAAWIGDPQILHQRPESFFFLDTETSGLAGGTGTYVFMIGIGRFTEEGFCLSQFFLRDPIEEPAQLAAVLGLLDECEVLVTYNGKSFDIPLLNSRYIFNSEPPPLKDSPHIDLLHLARRLWRDRLQSRTLGSIEENVLDVRRTKEDIPGWMVPTIYFDYLRSGDARPLQGVFYHNAMDILSLASLLNHISVILEDPHGGLVEHGIDLIAMGKIFEDMRELDAAAECYARGLEFEIPSSIQSQAIRRWSFMEKRRHNFEKSIHLWQTAADYKEIYAHVELAKIYEHRMNDYSQAIFWTEHALSIIQSAGFPDLERNIWASNLEHRLNRLKRKYERSQSL